MDNLKGLIDIEIEMREFGIEWPSNEVIISQIISECNEVKSAIVNKESKQRIQEELGDVLSSVISLCISLQFNVDDTIQMSTIKFSKRLSTIKKLLKALKINNLQGKDFNFVLDIWEKAKLLEKT